MAATTPRRSTRLPHVHTPKMSERKKSLFQGDEENARDSMTKHRNLPVLNSESDSDDCDLGIISTLDSSSDENGPKTPERCSWHDTRSQSRKLLKENNDLKSFIKSPFTLKKYRYSCMEKNKSISTPGTPQFQNHPGTPSSTHSCASIHTTSSSSSKARKSLADLIADTESCSSSLKDLNFDTDSGTDTKENTPTKVRRSSRRKMTPKLNSFKGILIEQRKNVTPLKTAVVSLTKMDMSCFISPTQMMKTPDNTSEAASPPKIRRSVVEIAESPESNDGDKSQKRLHYDGMNDGPSAKLPRLDLNSVPKARASLFNSDRLKEILSAKSFYGKSNPELNSNVTSKISNAIEVANTQNRRFTQHVSHSHRQKRRPGQINLGVRHKIRKPKLNKNVIIKRKLNLNSSAPAVLSSRPNNSYNVNASMQSHDSSQEMCNDKNDPFDKEKQTIDTLLSQWNEEDVPESELTYSTVKNDTIFNSTIIEETNLIFQQATAVPVTDSQVFTQDPDKVIVELGGQKQSDLPTEPVTQDVVMAEHMANHGDVPKNGQFLPVEGGYILVEENAAAAQEVLPDLDEIERELRMLDEQILKMAETNNIDPQAVIASTETVKDDQGKENDKKLFPIFKNPNPGVSATVVKEKSKKIIKTGLDQYVIDAGQKKFGATQCAECGVIYQIGDPQDEHDHLVHHNATDVLKFNGFKDEYTVHQSEGCRVVRIRGGEGGWRKVQSLLDRVVHPQLGYNGSLPGHTLQAYTAYLYIEKKQILGCCIAEPKSKAYKLLPGEPDCCSVESYPVRCGISRIWTHASHRRRHIASRLLDCARVSFLYGEVLPASQLAFSAPTPPGKALAAKYCGTDNFFVYLD